MLDNKMLENQALSAHALFFDDVHRNLVLAVDEQGRPAGKYVVIPEAVKIHENADVTFSYFAPDAKCVQIDLFDGTDNKNDMEKGEDGWWHVTVSGIDSGFHYHDYYVDGTRALNPHAPYGYGCGRIINYFEMPDKYSNFYLMQDVPHGTVRMNYYKSETLGETRNCWVYTPPTYETSPDKHYPVLYLQHGGGEAEADWIWQGKINHIADNLIADGACEELIIVMNYGVALPKNGVIGNNPMIGLVDDVIVKDCVPFIDAKYRTIANRHGRAMAGLSMGAAQTQHTVFKYPKVFASAGIFSAYFETSNETTQKLLEDPKKFNEKFDLLFLGAGEYEPLSRYNRKITQELRAKGIQSVFYCTPGGHDWTSWRYCAREFITRLWR